MSEVTAEMVAEMMRQEVEKMQIDKEADATAHEVDDDR